MKKRTVLILMLMSLLVSPAFASDYASKYAGTGSESRTALGNDDGAAAMSDALINNDTVNLNRMINDLETRINNLERENRFQNERMRRMDRTITDLKRRS